MSEIKYVQSKLKGRTGVYTPFNRAFVNKLKTLVPSAKWNGEAWFFDDLSRQDVEKLVVEFFPPQEELQQVVITWELQRDDPQIDGVSLTTITRDWWAWRKNCPIQFRPVEVEVESGGSRRNPGLFGKLVIEATIRPNATVTPEPDSIGIVNGNTTGIYG